MLLSVACSRRQDHVDELLSRCDSLDKAYTSSNVDSILVELKAVEAHPAAQGRPEIATFATMLKARASEFRGDYDTAIVRFGRVLATPIPPDTAGCHWAVTLGNVHWSLVQMLNCYQMKGAADGCTAEFERLVEEPTPVLARNFMPDVYAILGYAHSRNNEPGRAAAAIDKAMSYSLDSIGPKRQNLIYTYAAAACFDIPEKQHQVMEWCEHCIDTAEHGGDVGGLHGVTSVLGSLYQRTGEVSKAIDMYRRSYETSDRVNDRYGVMNSCVMLSDLYITYNMPRLADVYATVAMDEIENAGNMQYAKMSGYALLVKGKIMQLEDKPDSAEMHWSRADSIFATLPFDSGMADLLTCRGEMCVLDSAATATQLHTSIGLLRSVVERSVTSVTRARAFYMLAEGYGRLGDHRNCEAALDSMVRLLNLTERPVFVERAYRFGLDYYLRKGDREKIELFSRKLNREMELFYNQKTYDAVVGQMLQFQADRKEAQMRAAEAELSRKDVLIRNYVLLSLLLMVLLVSAVAFFINRRRIYRMRTAIAKERIDTLIENLHEANMRSDEMEKRLNALPAPDGQEWQRVATLTPQALRKEGEVRFRERFGYLYPNFMPQLRSMAPSITRREEVLAMLIALEQNSEQVADVMCIARTSVNMMRHRLRQKMNLEKAQSLEDTLKALVV